MRTGLADGEQPDDVDVRATEATMELHDEGPRTRMVFTQTGLPSEGSRAGHAEGWEQALEDPGRVLAREGGAVG